MIAPLKFILVFVSMIFYTLTSTLLWPLSFLGEYKHKVLLHKHLRYYCRFVCWFMGIKVISKNQHFKLAKTNYLFVANHLSYLDIIALSSVLDSAYVTSLEMKKVPILGQLTQLAGCLYVNRKNRSNIMQEIQEIEKALRHGLNVTIFPEATSTNGEELKGFKRSLYAAAVYAQVDVLPIAINYMAINQQAVNRKNRDLVCWYGDMSFAPHLWKLCQQKSVSIQLNFCSSISSKLEEDETTADLRDRSREVVSQNFSPFL